MVPVEFLYALWRDVVWDAAMIALQLYSVGVTRFLYAWWRDVVWDLEMSRGRGSKVEFLYAWWRDVVWDPGPSTRATLPSTMFLYALWRDVVWDPIPSGGACDQRRCSLFAQVPRGGPNLAVFSRSVRLFVLVGRLHR